MFNTLSALLSTKIRIVFLAGCIASNRQRVSLGLKRNKVVKSNTTAHDADLNPVLNRASTKELDILHDILVAPVTEMLTIEEAYKRHHPKHRKYRDLMAKELRDFGGHSLANTFRGEGPSYHEVACDVAKKIGAPFNRHNDIGDVEASILQTIWHRTLDKLSEEERRLLLAEIGRSGRSNSTAGPASAMAFQAAFRAGGFASYKMMLIVVNAVLKKTIGRGLSVAANAALTRTMGIAVGPIGWVLTSLWALVEIGGPAYRVTVPAVAYVAWLRKCQCSVPCGGCGAVVDGTFGFCPECGAELKRAA